MKYRLSAVAIGCLALELMSGAVAYAEEARFTGPAAAIGLGIARNQVDWSDSVGSRDKKTTAVGRLDLSYGFGLAPQVVLNVGASYDLHHIKFGNYSYVENGSTYQGSIKMKRHFSLYAAPGYQFSPNWLGYAKFAWHNAKVEYIDAGENDQLTHNGFGFGAGANVALTKNIEMRFEIQHVLFNRRTAVAGEVFVKPKSTEAFVYLGYRF